MPDETAELHNYIPAGECRPMTDSWNRAHLAKTTKPLPEAFIKAAIAQGSIVPPYDGPDPLLWRGVRNGLLITGVCAFVIWAIIHFTRV